MSAALIAVALLSYLLGSIPSGYLLARTRRIDVRAVGSGNIGATNVARTAGASLGILTLLLDALKGALPVVLVTLLARELGFAASETVRLQSVAAMCAVAGHVFSIFLRLRGGKGVATAFGALLALAPSALPLPLLLFTGLFAWTRRVSVGSMAAAAACPVGSLLAGDPIEVTLACSIIAGLILLRHRDNLARLLAGTEPRF